MPNDYLLNVIVKCITEPFSSLVQSGTLHLHGSQHQQFSYKEHKQFSFRIKLQCASITKLTLQTLTSGPTKLLVTELVETNTNMINQNVH